MKKQRYFIQRTGDGRHPVADMSHQYHGVFIDPGIIFGIGEMSPNHIIKCREHVDTVLLPSIHSPELVKDVCIAQGLPEFFTAMARHGVSDTDTTYQAALKIYTKFGHPHLEPDR